MAKKSKSSLAKFLTPLALILGVASICMIFLTAINYTTPITDKVVEYTGMQVSFGFKETSSFLGISATVEWFKFSFMNTLTYILVLVGAVFALLNVLGKKSKLFTLISAICFIAGAVLFFMVIACSIVGLVPNTEIATLDKDCMSIGIGAILGGILSAVAGACQVLAFLFKK